VSQMSPDLYTLRVGGALPSASEAGQLAGGHPFDVVRKPPSAKPSPTESAAAPCEAGALGVEWQAIDGDAWLQTPAISPLPTQTGASLDEAYGGFGVQLPGQKLDCDDAIVMFEPGGGGGGGNS